MTCLGPDRLAAAASGEDDAAVVHALACSTCRDVLDEQRAIRAIVVAAPVPSLAPARRSELAAEILARADAPARRRVPRVAIAGACAVAAAIAAFVATHDAPSTPAPPVSVAAPPTPPVEPAPTPTVAEPPTELPAEPPPTPSTPALRPSRIAGRADFTRSTARNRDLVDLRDGELTIDARRARPVDVTVHGTTLRITGTKATIVARGGAIHSVTVVAGSVEITGPSGRHVVDTGELWVASPRDDASAFADGWRALRDRRYADAIAAFDRATASGVAEDAAYWAAVAAERSGDIASAMRRYADFLVRFPTSPRRDSAREAAARLR